MHTLSKIILGLFCLLLFTSINYASIGAAQTDVDTDNNEVVQEDGAGNPPQTAPDNDLQKTDGALLGDGVIKGTIYAEDGQVVPNAVITLTFVEDDVDKTVYADQNGAYVIKGIPVNRPFWLIVCDPKTGAYADSGPSVLKESTPTQQFTLTLVVPKTVNETATNLDFSDGFNGWEVTGDAQIVPEEEGSPEDKSDMDSK
ncbi:MAG TPA: carboxypeptidase-like regulatory domain-containing protein [Bacillota bacterium]|nr:carboxypeptidase-like regulatory domain-containing protein [Bacillota bacterium]